MRNCSLCVEILWISYHITLLIRVSGVSICIYSCILWVWKSHWKILLNSNKKLQVISITSWNQFASLYLLEYKRTSNQFSGTQIIADNAQQIYKAKRPRSSVWYIVLPILVPDKISTHELIEPER